LRTFTAAAICAGDRSNPNDLNSRGSRCNFSSQKPKSASNLKNLHVGLNAQEVNKRLVSHAIQSSKSFLLGGFRPMDVGVLFTHICRLRYLNIGSPNNDYTVSIKRKILIAQKNKLLNICC
jgi:hypothetical protein